MRIINVRNPFKSLYIKFTELSLQNKLVVLYITLFMIPVIIIVIVYSNEFYKNAIQDSIKQNEYLMELERIHIEKNIETMRESAQIIASDYEFMDFVGSKKEKTVTELIDFQREYIKNMINLQTVNPSINHLRLFVDNPYVHEMWPILFHESRIQDAEWLAESIDNEGQELWWLKKEDFDLLSNIKENNPKISLYREVKNLLGDHLGLIEITMLQQNFFPKMFSSISDGLSEMIIVNREGQIFKNARNTFLQTENFSGQDYDYILNEIDDQTAEMDSFLYSNAKVPYLVLSTFIEDIDAHLVNIISLNDIYGETKKVRNITLVTAIIILVILSAVTYKMVSLLLNKMYKLIDKMKEVEKGNLSTDIAIEGQGEFAILAFHFKNMVSQINKLIADAVHKQAVIKDTELKALRTQIDSHFLYNTLENIKMMAEIEGKYEISDSLTSLGEMMRYNIKWKNEFVLLQDEISHIKNYVDIMNLRLDHELSLVTEIPDELYSQEILKLSLQPIIENAIKHGIEPSGADTQIYSLHVKAYVEDQSVIIEITDNGVGMTMDAVRLLNKDIQNRQTHTVESAHTRNGIGLKNVHDRIILFYGKEYGIQINSVKDVYTTVKIKLPYYIIRGPNSNE